METHSHQLIKASKRLEYGQLSNAGAAAAWLQARPELVHLERCLRAYLGAQAGLPDGADLDMLPHAKGEMVRMRSAILNPVCIVV